jgi:alpha-D-xyloside xylohydrolase
VSDGTAVITVESLAFGGATEPPPDTDAVFTCGNVAVAPFAQRPPEDLYRRWTAFGMLTSHSRCHGAPPREPWEYSPQFLEDFRRADDMRYRLMPYIYAQAKDSSERGLPMLRALLVEFPEDPGAWLVEDEYLFGSDLLVAPLLESGSTGRDVYLPKGQWIDYQTGKVYAGGWQNIEAGPIPAVMLVRDGAILPQMQPAQSTSQLDWKNLEMVVYAATGAAARGLVCLPSDNVLRRVEAARRGNSFVLTGDPLAGKALSTVRLYSAK